MKVPIAISLDVSYLALPPAISVHKCVPPTPPTCPHVEPPVPLWWPPGIATGQNKWTTNVKAMGKTITLSGHNVGTAIPHIPLGPQGGLAAVLAKSSRSVNFSTSTVHMNGAATAAISWGPDDLPMSVCCEPCALPTGDATNFLNPPAYVGVTLADYIAGWVSIALSSAVSVATRDASKGQAAAAAAAASIAAGAAQVAATGEGTVAVSYGSPPLQVSVGVAFKDGKWTSVGAGVAGMSGQYNRDGTWQASAPDPNDPTQQKTSKTGGSP